MTSYLKRAIAVVLAAMMLLAVVGCEGEPLSTREKGTFVGTGLGAATGAIVGAAVGHPLAGAALGGVLGGGTGYLAGNALQNEEHHQRQIDDELSEQQKEIERQRREIEELKQMAELE
jgi:phage tail tape-measure protein